VKQAVVAQTFSYSDGSGNSYSFDQGTRKLIYAPVTPAMSSSGIYDGGPPWQRELSEQEISVLQDLLKNAEMATDQHQAERAKGTGQLQMSGGEKLVILKMSSPLRTEIEATLKSLKP
jgi:hypothetical protein